MDLGGSKVRDQVVIKKTFQGGFRAQRPHDLGHPLAKSGWKLRLQLTTKHIPSN